MSEAYCPDPEDIPDWIGLTTHALHFLPEGKNSYSDYINPVIAEFKIENNLTTNAIHKLYNIPPTVQLKVEQAYPGEVIHIFRLVMLYRLYALYGDIIHLELYRNTSRREHEQYRGFLELACQLGVKAAAERMI